MRETDRGEGILPRLLHRVLAKPMVLVTVMLVHVHRTRTKRARGACLLTNLENLYFTILQRQQQQ